ncbi:MAG: DUF1614 domain-containing protein [Firmicutes bacterium]|nr:DUF1614 domain-containing protein [Bacillota bacterium]
MIQLPFSIILLSVVMLLILLGLAQRVLDRMRLTDKTALVMLLLLIISHFLPKVSVTSYLALNLGALIPLGIIGYLLITAEKGERIRAIIISLVTAFILWVTDQLLPITPGKMIFDLDPLYIPGIAAGLISYFTTRSRRSAFISAIAAVFLNDLWAAFSISPKTYHAQIVLGGGGIFDALLINGIIAVLIAEGIGEIRERIHRGPAKVKDIEDGDSHD